jgi:hypothetical protein
MRIRVKLFPGLSSQGDKPTAPSIGPELEELLDGYFPLVVVIPPRLVDRHGDRLHFMAESFEHLPCAQGIQHQLLVFDRLHHDETVLQISNLEMPCGWIEDDGVRRTEAILLSGPGFDPHLLLNEEDLAIGSTLNVVGVSFDVRSHFFCWLRTTTTSEIKRCKLMSKCALERSFGVFVGKVSAHRYTPRARDPAMCRGWC